MDQAASKLPFCIFAFKLVHLDSIDWIYPYEYNI